MEEIDLNLIKDDVVERTFVATFEDGSPQSLAGHTVKMIVYRDPIVELIGSVGGADNNEVTILFDNTINGQLGLFEFEIIASPVSGVDILLGRGNISFNPSTGFTTQIQTLIQKESLGIPLDADWVTQSILYWKLFFQPTYELSDAQLADDNNFPVLTRFLIAKLVTYDYIAHLMQVTIASSFGTTADGVITGGSGALKKLITGPSSAEWYDTSAALQQLSAKGANGQSAFDMMGQGICTLASRLGLWLPMCGLQPNTVVIPLRGSDMRRRCYPLAVTILKCITCEPDRG